MNKRILEVPIPTAEKSEKSDLDKYSLDLSTLPYNQDHSSLFYEEEEEEEEGVQKRSSSFPVPLRRTHTNKHRGSVDDSTTPVMSNRQLNNIVSTASSSTSSTPPTTNETRQKSSSTSSRSSSRKSSLVRDIREISKSLGSFDMQSVGHGVINNSSNYPVQVSKRNGNNSNNNNNTNNAHTNHIGGSRSSTDFADWPANTKSQTGQRTQRGSGNPIAKKKLGVFKERSDSSASSEARDGLGVGIFDSRGDEGTNISSTITSKTSNISFAVSSSFPTVGFNNNVAPYIPMLLEEEEMDCVNFKQNVAPYDGDQEWCKDF